MIWVSLCAIVFAMLLIRLGILTVMVMVFAMILKALALLALVATGLFCWKRIRRRHRKLNHLI